jgi:hypothetical protein
MYLTIDRESVIGKGRLPSKKTPKALDELLLEELKAAELKAAEEASNAQCLLQLAGN